MGIVSFYRIKERSRRIIWLLIASLICYWILGCSLLAQMARFLLFGLFDRTSGPWLDTETVAIVAVLSCVVAAGHYCWATRSVIRRTLKMYGAQPLDPTDPYHTVFQNTVDEIRIATGNRIPITCMVIPCGALNGFSLCDPQGRATVGLTEGVLARMKRNETQAVVAQLTGQVLSKDALINTVAFSLFASLEDGVDQALGTTRQTASRHAQGRPLDIVSIFLFATKIFLRLGSVFNMFLSRERIYRNDALAVELTRDPVGIAMALQRLTRAWRGSGTFGAATESVLFVPPGRGKHDTDLGFVASLFRSHPPLKARLKRCLDMAGTSIATVDELLKKPAAHRAAGIDAKVHSRAKWKIYNDGVWQGPFTLAVLKAMPQLTRLAYVCRLGTTEVVQAGDDELLAQEFFGKKVKHDDCPRCGGSLIKVRYEGVAIMACQECGGRLVPNDAVQRILVRHIVPIPPEVRTTLKTWKEANAIRPIRNHGKDDPEKIPCPRCKRPMTRNFYSAQYFLEVDRCYPCKVTWFDVEELEILQALVEEANEEILQAKPS